MYEFTEMQFIHIQNLVLVIAKAFLLILIPN